MFRADLVQIEHEGRDDGDSGLAAAVASSAVVEPTGVPRRVTPGRASSPTDGRRTASSAARTSSSPTLYRAARASTTCRLVDGTLGSTHMALTLVSLVEGHVDEHVHSYETSFYVLEGEPLLYLEGRGVKLTPGACGAVLWELRTRFAATARRVDRDGLASAAHRRQ